MPSMSDTTAASLNMAVSFLNAFDLKFLHSLKPKICSVNSALLLTIPSSWADEVSFMMCISVTSFKSATHVQRNWL